MKYFLTVIATVLLSGLFAGHAFAYSLSSPAPGFGPDQYQDLISDPAFTAVDMNETAINDFLKKQGLWASRNGGVSWLADYQIPEYQTVPYKYTSGGVCTWSTVSVRQYNDVAHEPLYGMSVAALIAQKEVQKGIAAEVILATLEKESSAITRTTPQSDAVQMWVLGYGWNDSIASCAYDQATAQAQAVAYGGVGQQIAYAMNWFSTRYTTYATTYANPITTTDGATIVAKGRGTRSLYSYTPYVYNGNYNFWLLTRQWFAPPVFQPSGGLALDPGGTVYVIDNGLKWPVTGAGFDAWAFKWSDVHTMTPTESALPDGGSVWTQLPTTSDGSIYLIENGRKRAITSERLMQRFSFSWSDVQPKPSTLLDRVPSGLPLHELTTAMGSDGTVYLATGGVFYPVTGSGFSDSWNFSASDIGQVPGYVLYDLPRGPVLTNLVYKQGDTASVYMIDDGKIYPITGQAAQAWNIDFSLVRTVGAGILSEKADGGLLSTLVTRKGGDGAVYQIQGGKKLPITGNYFRAHFDYKNVRSMGVALDNLPVGKTLK